MTPNNLEKDQLKSAATNDGTTKPQPFCAKISNFLSKIGSSEATMVEFSVLLGASIVFYIWLHYLIPNRPQISQKANGDMLLVAEEVATAYLGIKGYNNSTWKTSF